MSENKRRIIITVQDDSISTDFGDLSWMERVGAIETVRALLELETCQNAVGQQKEDDAQQTAAERPTA